MNNFFKKQREVLAILFYAIFVGGLIYFVVLPLLGGINNTVDEIEQENMKQESMKLQIAELPNIQNQYSELEKAGDLKSVLLDKSKAVTLIEKLEKLAESTNNKITISVSDVVAPSAPAKKTNAKGAKTEELLVDNLPNGDYLKMKITLTGNYNAILKFINKLEQFEYYSDIIGIKISKDQVVNKSKSSSSDGMFGVAAVSSVDQQQIVDNGELTAELDSVFYTN
ncbi:MAG: hypothetical protein WCI36_04595 [bacterium]